MLTTESRLQCIDDLERRLSIAKEVGDRAGEGMAYGNLGICYEILGRYKEAIEYHNNYDELPAA